jgi:hypothetical protein
MTLAFGLPAVSLSYGTAVKRGGTKLSYGSSVPTIQQPLSSPISYGASVPRMGSIFGSVNNFLNTMSMGLDVNTSRAPNLSATGQVNTSNIDGGSSWLSDLSDLTATISGFIGSNEDGNLVLVSQNDRSDVSPTISPLMIAGAAAIVGVVYYAATK